MPRSTSLDHALVGRAVFLRVARARFIPHHHHVDVGIVRSFRRRAGADLDDYGVAVAAVHQAMAVRQAGLPGRRLAGPQHGLAAVLAQNHLAFEHVDELVLLLMPVALRRGGSRLQGADVDTELGQAGCSTEPFARAPLYCPVERRRIMSRLVERQLVDIDFWHFVHGPERGTFDASLITRTMVDLTG